MRSLLIPAIGLPSGEHISDARLFALALVTLAGCVLWQGFVAWRHRRTLRAIPVRIHVAGTRGKSTTTRLIAAALRATGRTVIAKTTGSEPPLILSDGSEEPWPRRGPASVREQVRFVARATALGADAIVAECMAIRPELVFASEKHLIQATTTVITNARADHLADHADHFEFGLNVDADLEIEDVKTLLQLLLAIDRIKAEHCSPAFQLRAAVVSQQWHVWRRARFVWQTLLRIASSG